MWSWQTLPDTRRRHVRHNQRALFQRPFFMPTPFKIPQSVLVVIHTPELQVLLIQRADAPDFWQSVTGAKDFETESYRDTAVREVMEETGIDATASGHTLLDWNLQNSYQIYPQWRHRYAPGVVRNTEQVFGLCVPACLEVRLNPREHLARRWLPWQAAAERCFSPSNAEAILHLPRFAAAR
jgi:dATP pyrophosphohydrolase